MRHERRDVERLVDAAVEHRAVAGARQHVGVALAPRRVRDLGDDGLEALAARREAVVEAHRVEAVPERARLGEQPHRAAGVGAGAPGDERADRVGERHGRVAEVVGAAEAHEPRPARDEPAAEQRAAARRGRGRAARGGGGTRARARRSGGGGSCPRRARCRGITGSARRARAATRIALATPSSWKPQPQYAPQKCVRRRPLISPWRRWAATPSRRVDRVRVGDRAR